MNDNPYSNTRYPQASENFNTLLACLKEGDEEQFGKIVEHEALGLHALMMLSSPWVLLLEPNTIAILYKIREFRTSTGLQLYFTIDAGPNVHLIYSGKIKKQVHEFIQSELINYCEKHQVINDCIGNGPKKLA
jgi:diphosphomevalonate decarboxylase